MPQPRVGARRPRLAKLSLNLGGELKPLDGAFDPPIDASQFEADHGLCAWSDASFNSKTADGQITYCGHVIMRGNAVVTKPKASSEEVRRARRRGGGARPQRAHALRPVCWVSPLAVWCAECAPKRSPRKRSRRPEPESEEQEPFTIRGYFGFA